MFAQHLIEVDSALVLEVFSFYFCKTGFTARRELVREKGVLVSGTLIMRFVFMRLLIYTFFSVNYVYLV